MNVLRLAIHTSATAQQIYLHRSHSTTNPIWRVHLHPFIPITFRVLSAINWF